MAGIVEKIKDKLHMGGEKKHEEEDKHKSEGHIGEHKKEEGLVDKIHGDKSGEHHDDKHKDGENKNKKQKKSKKDNKEKKHKDGHDSSSSSDSDSD